MRSDRCFCLAVMLGIANAGCTFYTACPTDSNPPPNNNTGGTNGGGNDPGGGSSNLGAAPAGEWVSAASNLVELESECGNFSFMAQKPGEDRLIASIALNGLWQTLDGGDSWEPLGQGEDSAVIENRGSMLVFDPDDAGTFWESGTYNGGGVYKTEDDGDTFEQVGSVTHNDYLSIDFSDPDRRTMLASGHEENHKLYRSVDGGVTFDELGERLPDEFQVCAYPVLVDADTYLLGCGTYGGGAQGILRSTDAGESWEAVSDKGGASAPLVTSTGVMYWASEATDGIVRSEDQGETWSEPLGVNTVSRVHPIEMPDGSLATVGSNHVLISRDEGKSWTAASQPLPFGPTGLLYSDERKAFYVWQFTCETGNLPDNVVMRFDYDYSQATE